MSTKKKKKRNGDPLTCEHSFVTVDSTGEQMRCEKCPVFYGGSEKRRPGRLEPAPLPWEIVLAEIGNHPKEEYARLPTVPELL